MSKFNHYDTVWVNGCFDILHVGHIRMLEYASSLGGRMVVGVDTDERIKSLKGESRPVNTLEDRMEVLRSLRHVDVAVPFESEEQLIALLCEFRPVCRVLGSEYRDLPIVGAEFSGKIKFFDRISGYSTTETINEVKEEK